MNFCSILALLILNDNFLQCRTLNFVNMVVLQKNDITLLPIRICRSKIFCFKKNASLSVFFARVEVTKMNFYCNSYIFKFWENYRRLLCKFILLLNNPYTVHTIVDRKKDVFKFGIKYIFFYYQTKNFENLKPCALAGITERSLEIENILFCRLLKNSLFLK